VKEMFIEVMHKIPKSEINQSGIMDLDPFAGKNETTKKGRMCC
jgi:hypothetical protein